MPFTSGDMETAWTTLLAAVGESEWFDLIQPSTLNYFRVLVTGGTIRKWNRTTGAWDDVTATLATILASGTLVPVETKVQ
jgi:hypothetical protein